MSRETHEILLIYSDFTLQVRKKDGSLYPPGSIQNILRAINRLIRARQSQRCVETRERYILIDMFTDPIYSKVKICGDIAANRSNKAGLGLQTKRSDALTPSEERKMLALPKNQADTPEGANNKYFVFSSFCFFIKLSGTCD